MSLFQTGSFIVFVPGVYSVEFVKLLLVKLSCEAKQWRTAGINAAAASWTDGCLVSFIFLSSLPHAQPEEKTKSLILLSLLAWPPSCLPDLVASFSLCLLCLCCSICYLWTHLNIHREAHPDTAEHTLKHEHMHAIICPTEPLLPSPSEACLSYQLLRLKNERWNTYARLCRRWSTCGLRSSLWRTPGSARQTSSHCETLRESLVKIFFPIPI